MPGPSVFPSREPGVSGDFWGSQEGCQGVSYGRQGCRGPEGGDTQRDAGSLFFLPLLGLYC